MIGTLIGKVYIAMILMGINLSLVNLNIVSQVSYSLFFVWLTVLSHPLLTVVATEMSFPRNHVKQKTVAPGAEHAVSQPPQQSAPSEITLAAEAANPEIMPIPRVEHIQWVIDVEL